MEGSGGKDTVVEGDKSKEGSRGRDIQMRVVEGATSTKGKWREHTGWRGMKGLK